MGVETKLVTGLNHSKNTQMGKICPVFCSKNSEIAHQDYNQYQEEETKEVRN